MSPSIWKDYQDISEWPYVLSHPTDDASFNPVDLDGCAIVLASRVFLYGGLAILGTIVYYFLDFIGVIA